MINPTRFVFASDTHGDLVDPDALDALESFCADFKPTVRIAGGDHYDFRSLRRNRSDGEAAESLKSDLEAGEGFFKRFRPTVYLWGNHEARLEAIIHGSGDALHRDKCQELKDHINAVARRNGAKVILPYNRKKGVYRLGKVAFVHGYAHGLNATAEQGKHYADRGGALIHGHTHNVAHIALTKDGGGSGYSAGCLCLIDEMTYAATRLATSRWGVAFIAGWVDGDDWSVEIIRPSGEGKTWHWFRDIRIFTPKKRK